MNVKFIPLLLILKHFQNLKFNQRAFSNSFMFSYLILEKTRQLEVTFSISFNNLFLHSHFF